MFKPQTAGEPKNVTLQLTGGRVGSATVPATAAASHPAALTTLQQLGQQHTAQDPAKDSSHAAGEQHGRMGAGMCWPVMPD